MPSSKSLSRSTLKLSTIDYLARQDDKSALRLTFFHLSIPDNLNKKLHTTGLSHHHIKILILGSEIEAKHGHFSFEMINKLIKSFGEKQYTSLRHVLKDLKNRNGLSLIQSYQQNDVDILSQHFFVTPAGQRAIKTFDRLMIELIDSVSVALQNI